MFFVETKISHHIRSGIYSFEEETQPGCYKNYEYKNCKQKASYDM